MKTRRLIKCLALATLFLMAMEGKAINTQIQTDGSLSGIEGVDIHAVGSGQLYTLSELNGKLAGNNLYYSFSQFNIGSGDTTWFNLTTPGLEHIISRVTGGNESLIDGQLKLTNEGSQSSFYLINPAGIMFGPGASVDVPGSFYVSTASNLQFSDGTQLPINSAPISNLAVATPEAFGFLGNETGSLDFAGTESDKIELGFKPGAQIAFVANQINIDQVKLFNTNEAQAGLDLQLIATGDTTTAINWAALPSQATGGQLVLDNSLLNASGSGSGRMTVRAGDFVANNSSAFVANQGDMGVAADHGIDITTTTMTNHKLLIGTIAGAVGKAGDIRIETKQMFQGEQSGILATTSEGSTGGSGSIVINAGELKLNNQSAIITSANGSGKAGTITIKTEQFEINQDSSVINTATTDVGEIGIDITAKTIKLSGQNSGIFAQDLAGRAGGKYSAISLNAAILELDGGNISSLAIGKYHAADLVIVVDHLRITNKGGITSGANRGSVGHGGLVTIHADQIDLNQGSIRSSTLGSGNAGNIVIDASVVRMLDNTTISASSNSSETVHAGVITIKADQLAMDNSAITSDTNNKGNAGDVSVMANTISVHGGRISSDSFSDGHAGQVKVAGQTIALSGSATISSNAEFDFDLKGTLGNGGGVIVEAAVLTLDNAKISARTLGNGDAGSVQVTATSIKMTNDASISASAFAEGMGDGGTLIVKAKDLELNNSFISSRTVNREGQAGDIQIEADYLTLMNQSRVILNSGSKNFRDVSGHGGKLTVDATQVLLADSFISSEAYGQGDAGQIQITADQLVLREKGFISTSTFGTGRAGDIEILANTLTSQGAGSTTVDFATNDLSGIFSAASADSSGQVGNISVSVTDALRLNHGAQISIVNAGRTDNSSAVAPNFIHIKAGNLYLTDNSLISSASSGNITAGNLLIEESQLIQLRDSQITTSVSGLAGDGGDITIVATALVMDTGFIQANTDASGGAGGNVKVAVPNIIPSGNNLWVGGNTPFLFQPASGLNVIQAAAPTGVSGVVAVSTPQLNLSGTLASLGIDTFDTESLNRNFCAIDERSSLLQSGRGGQRHRARDFLLFTRH